MEIKVEIIKDIPKEKLDLFKDRVIYYTAVLTRENTKTMNAYPYLTGELARQEIKSQITGKDAEYSLLAGTDYAKYVWKMTDVKWTNSATRPKWYYNIYKQKEKSIVETAQNRAIKEIK